MKTLHTSAYRRLVQRLRHARVAAGLSQSEAAEAVGRPQSFVSKCEAGERRLDVLELLEFARLYGRRLEYFVAEADAPLTGGGALVSGERRRRYGGAPSRRRPRRRRS
jgi:transcriptional regulator with XRE-family HTH domain